MIRRLVGRELLRWHLEQADSSSVTDKIGSQYSSNNVNPFVFRLLKDFSEKRLESSDRLSIVEFGARAGYLGRSICRNNPRIVYTGFEPYPPHGEVYRIYAESCEESLKSEISEQLLRRADVFVFADVLEHLIDPWSYLQSLNRIAKESAHLIVSIPNFFHHSALSLISDGEFNYEEWGVLDMTHLRFFGLPNIVQLIGDTGWYLDSSNILPAMDPKGLEIFNSYRSGELHSWTDHKLTWRIDSESDALALASYQFVMIAKKLP